jgi:4,5-DOPA dioxygenase extradiol
MPSLFVSHGSPMIMLSDDVHRSFVHRSFLAGLAATLPRPAAILAITAHWESTEPRLNAAAHPGTWHDFGGFPAALHALDYPAPGQPALAARAARLVGGIAEERPKRDHGTWVPLMLIYPDADIPVVELSVQPGRDARHHLEIGRALAPLRDDGVLILGSGSATHNLRDFFRPPAELPTGYPEHFTDWLTEAIEAGDDDRVADWKTAPFATRAHPSDEHFLPLAMAMGAGLGPGRRIHDGADGALRMDAYRWD